MSKVDRRAKLLELRALRQSGKKAFDNYEVAEVADLYDEVDEAGYKKIVRDRLDQDDFVVDDNGEGYADDGREEWDRVRRYESDSEAEDLAGRGRPSKAGLSASVPQNSVPSLTRYQPRRIVKKNKPSETPTKRASTTTLKRAPVCHNQSQRYAATRGFPHPFCLDDDFLTTFHLY